MSKFTVQDFSSVHNDTEHRQQSDNGEDEWVNIGGAGECAGRSRGHYKPPSILKSFSLNNRS